MTKLGKQPDSPLKARKFTKGGFDGFRQRIERWHEGPHGGFRRFAYDYLHGDREVILLNSQVACPSGRTIGARELPDKVATGISACAKVSGDWKIGRELADDLSRKLCVVGGWDGQYVLVHDVEFLEQDEVFVPSRIRFETFERSPNLFGGLVYLSLMKSVLHCLFRPVLGERKLDLPVVEGIAVGGNQLEDPMIESRPQIVDRIANYDADLGYDGIVSFNADGAFTRIVIGFESVAERAAFLDKSVGFGDVLLGPLNLHGVTGLHD